MAEVVSRAQGLIRVEETRKSALNEASKPSNGEGSKDLKKGNPGKAQKQGDEQLQQQK